jgi:hypothetical protein
MEAVDLLALESLFGLLIELVTECGLLIARQRNEFEPLLERRWPSGSSLSISEPEV